MAKRQPGNAAAVPSFDEIIHVLNRLAHFGHFLFQQPLCDSNSTVAAIARIRFNFFVQRDSRLGTSFEESDSRGQKSTQERTKR
jgi:hypothetical protein